MTPLRSWDFTHGFCGIKHMGDADDCPDEEEIEIMQFTGLKDKNGKPIYEGDVTYSEWNKPFVGRDDGTKRIVIWSDRLGGWGESNDGTDADMRVTHLKTHALPQTEVIGNIWENPDLTPSPST